MAAARGGDVLLFASDGGRLLRKTKTLTAELGFRRSTSAFFSVTFSPDGKLVAAGSESDVTLWDVRSGRPLLSFEPRGSLWPGLSVGFSPDGTTLAVGVNGFLSFWPALSTESTLVIALYEKEQWLATVPNRLWYASSAFGDQYASIFFPGIETSFPLKYYRGSLKRADLSHSLADTQPTIEPAYLRLAWDNPPNTNVLLIPFACYVVALLLVAAVLERVRIAGQLASLPNRLARRKLKRDIGLFDWPESVEVLLKRYGPTPFREMFRAWGQDTSNLIKYSIPHIQSRIQTVEDLHNVDLFRRGIEIAIEELQQAVAELQAAEDRLPEPLEHSVYHPAVEAVPARYPPGGYGDPSWPGEMLPARPAREEYSETWTEDPAKSEREAIRSRIDELRGTTSTLEAFAETFNTTTADKLVIRSF